MSQKLPETADEMLQISHVTKANFEKYGEGLLKICQQHAADKKGEMLELGNNILRFMSQNVSYM
jgi:bloom syndrome protein